MQPFGGLPFGPQLRENFFLDGLLKFLPIGLRAR
jgi:hypothetical protein